MANYYFVITCLPPIEVGVKPEMGFNEIRDMLSLNLTSADFQQVRYLVEWIDLYNLRSFWMGLPLDDRGNFSEAKLLEEALLVRDQFPSYVVEFLERFESTEDRIKNFSALFAECFRNEPERRCPFLDRYFAQEREIRLVLAALRAKILGSDIIRQLQFEDVHDPLVAHILAQKDAAEYSPPTEYEDLKTVFVQNRKDPKSLERAILKYRFEKIEEQELPQDFSIDRVMAYLARLLIVESISRLDEQLGKQILDKLSQHE